MAKRKSKEETAVSKVNEATAVGEALDLFQADAGVGMENIEANDMAIPFIALLQALSPQVKKKTVEGAEDGMFMNTVTNKLYEEIYVIPCAFSKAWVEWVAREKGGGFVQQHMDDALVKETTRDDKNRDILPNGNSLVQTAYHYVLVVDKSGAYYRAVISMTRTQLKVSRKWNTRMKELKLPGTKGMFTPPSFSHVYKLTSIDEEKSGNSWKNYSVSEPMPVKSTALYIEAKKFNKEVMNGLIKVVPPVDESIEPELNDTVEENNF